jgi:hypothetical protein
MSMKYYLNGDISFHLGISWTTLELEQVTP